MKQQQRKALALAAVLALCSVPAVAQPAAAGARGAQAAHAAADAAYKAYGRRDYPAAVQAACETRRLVGQQAQAFAAAALPLCRSV